MKRLEDFIKSVVQLSNDDINILKGDDLDDDKYEELRKKAEAKIAKSYESTVGKELLGKAKTEAYMRSQIKFRKAMNNKLGLGLSSSDIEAFESDEDFSSFVGTHIEKAKDTLRKDADKETIKELSTVKTQLSKLRGEYDSVIEKRDKEIEEIKTQKAKEVEEALAENYYNMKVSQNKKIDREIAGINLSLRTIKSDLFNNATVKRNGEIESKDGTAFLLDERVIESVDEYLEHVLEKEGLLEVHNASKEPRQIRERQRGKSQGELSEAALKKKAEMEAVKRRATKEEPKSRWS